MRSKIMQMVRTHTGKLSNNDIFAGTSFAHIKEDAITTNAKQTEYTHIANVVP